MNYLLGAISGNYTIENIKNWVNTSNFENVQRVLFYYIPSQTSEIDSFCKENNIWLFFPNFNLYGKEQKEYIANSGLLNVSNAYCLIHHVRFLHFAYFLKNSTKPKDNIITTDVTDVIFNGNPFEQLESWKFEGIIASSEEILHKDENWNLENYYSTFGFLTNYFKNTKIYNAGFISGTSEILQDLFNQMYLLCLFKSRNADQAAYNYLIQTSFKDKTKFTHMEDYWGLHLHVIKNNNIPFNLNDIPKYKVIHQYDRLGDEIQHYYTLPK